jgi:hypothetical protein
MVNSMAMHGFGTGNGSDEKRVRVVISELMKVKGVTSAHYVKHTYGEGPNYDIIFRFGHWTEFGYENFQELLDEIKDTGIHNLNIYTIQKSFP